MADIFDQLASEDKGLDIFDQIANDPGFFESLGQGFSRGAATVGTAKDILLTEAGTQSPERTAANIARRARENAQIPGSVALRQFNESQGALDALGTLAANPSIIGELTAESIPISGATLVAGGAGGLVGGVPGAAVGAGLVSGGSEYLLALQDQLAEDGVDLQDQEAVAAKIKDPEFRSQWREKGVKRGAAIGSFDGASMVIAGSFLAPVRKAALESGERMIGAQLKALGKESLAQVAGGTGGEAVAQLATGGIDSPQSIIAEGAAELPFSVVEAITGLQIRNRAANKISSAREAANAGMPATADTLAQQAYNELTQPTDEATGVSPTQEQPTEPTVGKTLDDLISEVASQPASAPDLAGVTTTEEVINEPITDEQASDSPATEEASQETQEEVAQANSAKRPSASQFSDILAGDQKGRRLTGAFGEVVPNYISPEGVEMTFREEGPIFDFNGEEYAADIHWDTLIISDTAKRGKGAASAEVDKMLKEADKYDLSISLEVNPEEATRGGGEIGLSKSSLKEWMQNKGFIFAGSYGYRPRKSENRAEILPKTHTADPSSEAEIQSQFDNDSEGVRFFSDPESMFEMVMRNPEKIPSGYLDSGNGIYYYDGKNRPVRAVNVRDNYDYQVGKLNISVEQPAVESAQLTTPNAQETTANPQTSSDRGSDVAGQVQESPVPVPEVQRLQPEQEVTDGGVTAPTPDISNPRSFKFSEIAPPETVDDWMFLREIREAAEKKLLQEEIGVNDDQASVLHRLIFKQDGTGESWAKKNLNPEQYEKFDLFFEESPYNQRGGPVDFFQYDDYYNPDLARSEKDKDGLSKDLVLAFTNGMPEEGMNDKWVFTVTAIRRLQELGATREDISNQLRAQAGRVAGSQSTAEEWYRTHGAEINNLIERFAPDMPVSSSDISTPTPIEDRAIQIESSEILSPQEQPATGEEVGEGIQDAQIPTQESPQEEVVSRKLEPESEFTRLAARGTGENSTPSEIDKIVTRLGVPTADVQDVAQDVAIKASQSYDPAGGATPLTWANSIAKTTVADYFRRQSAQKRDVAATVSTETPITEDVTVGESLVAPQRPVATDESAVQVAEALAAELTETEKTIIQRVVQGRETQTAVAKSLNLSQTRVSQIQKSALLKLKKQMQDRGFSREDIAFDEREEFPNFGPGAANILEFLNRPRTVTSTMNRVANEERAIRGELPVLMEAIQSNQETFDRAEALVEKNPNIGREIVVGLLNGTKTQVSEIDEAVLLYEKIRLRNEREMEVERASDPYESPESREEATKRWRELEEQITQLDQATRRSGTIWGRLGQFRQRLMRDDYTFEAMERKARVSKGRPLTAQESEEIRAQAERIAELEQQLAEAQRRSTEKGRVKATDEKLTELKTQATKRNATKKNVDLAGQSRNITERIKKRVDEGSDLSTLRGLVQRLALNFVRQGANTREVLVDAVHAVLSRIIPDIQRNTTMDLISGYGDFKPLDKEPAKQTLRELKGELQQLGKIGDMLNKQAPKKTGTERRTPSAEERRLIKEVNELKKRGGFEVTDPEAQLKSALDAIKTRLRNQIEDLDKAIADKEPLIQKDGSIEYDAEAAELRSRRDQLKLEYDEIFPAQPLSEEELIAKAARNLDRSIQRLEDDIKEGRLYPGAKPKQLSTPELEAKRATLEALRADRENLRNLDTQRVEMQKEAALRAAIDRAQDEIPNKTRGVDTVDTEEVARLKLELEAAKERRKAARNADVEYAEARRESVLLRAIERAQTASQKERGSPYTADTKRVAELKAQLAEIREAQAESPEAQQKRIDDAIKSVEESIRSYDQRIQEGNFAVRQTPEGPISDELEALQAERDAMRRLFNELRAAEKPKKTKEEIQLQSYKTRTLNRIAELQRKLLENDFAPPQKRDPVKLDAEGKKLEEQLYQAKKEYNEARFKDELKRRPLMRKIWDEGRHVLSTARAMMTSIDLSMIFRQAGFITIGNPNRAWKALPGMFRALRNERVRREVNADIWKRPNAELYRQSKLAITNPDETNMNKMEEAYMTRWASKIPGVAASERAYTTFLNLIRADTFDTLVATLGRDGAVSKEEADALANYVNVATGRGNLAGASGTGFTLNSVFFAPRLLWSRFELLAGQPFYKGSKRTRNLVLREYAKFLIGIATLYNLALTAGFEVEWDPRSSDFGKIRFGNVRIDPLAGLAQVTTLLSRVFSGQKKTLSGKVQDIRGDNIPYGGETTYDVAGRFLRTKLNPALGAVVDLSVGRNVIGEKVTPLDAARRSVTPLSLQDVTDVFKEYGILAGTALTLLEMIGFGVQNFETNNPQPSSQAP